MKKYSSALFFSISAFLYGTLWCMESSVTPKQTCTQSRKVRELKDFFKTVELEENEKVGILNYFNSPDTGMPICKKIEQGSRASFLYRGFKQIEEAVLGYPLSEWQNILKFERLRIQGKTASFEKNSDYEKCEDEEEIVKKLMPHINIPQTVYIPVFKKKYSEISSCSWNRSCIFELDDNNRLTYSIYSNPEVGIQLKLPDYFGVAHEIEHVKRGLWVPYRNLLGVKLLLGTISVSAVYYFYDSKDFKHLWVKPCLCAYFGLIGVFSGNVFKQYFKRQEEIACDLGALETCKKAGFLNMKNVVELNEGLGSICLNANFTPKYRGKNWIIQELKVTRQEKPKEYSWSRTVFGDDSHPSDAQRVDCLKKRAKELNV